MEILMSRSEIALLENQRYEAMRRHDVATLTRLVAEEMVYMHSNAESDTKEDYLRKVGDGTYVYHRINVSERSITILADTALVFARMAADITVSGRRKAIDNKGLAVWVKDAGRWKLVAYQPTVIPQPSAHGRPVPL
ncbi:nuclear transport factor 2 family protein [Mesorhizobium sp. CGMCC 1.15528]|uniref:Nuclear transport factor 2 family protein n=1 Tax=Mesorhizobium zhangyense TaxID=1776730 RepID=A0A7C9VHB5_9HYPH|nr:nuclear transport factor 2 family protein [Mesorhizobium zhangyense]NGN44650.1 nuclear transport factor 2 family protein [Mesorhizobium zhangyense]